MEYFTFDCGALPAAVNISRFQGESGVDEYHLMIHPTEEGGIDDQLSWLSRAYHQALDAFDIKPQSAVLRRFFCSDPPSQAAALEASPLANRRNQDESCAVSLIGQSPAPPAKVALWAYHLKDPQEELAKCMQDSSLAVKRGPLTHHWTTGLVSAAGETSASQTRDLFEQYGAYLKQHNLSLADHVVRTWLFVRNIDVNYQGLVEARRELFQEQGLTPETHYLASTGIEGASAEASAKVVMDAYAISGLRSAQVEYLSAPDFLGPTHLYGVTFERGVSVAYRDRKHVIISGTASIDPTGEIMHPGNVLGQLERTLDNIEALLNNGGATFKDMCAFIVYLRNIADDGIVREQMRQRFGAAPLVVADAPVCRPGWLIEVEGLAIIAADNPPLPAL